jgi:long-subunit fatty acid transport protein
MKNFLITAIAVLSFATANAQSNIKGGMHANAMAGVLTGSAKSEDDGSGVSYKYSVTGSNFGAQFQYAIEDSFSVGIGLESNAIKLRVKDAANNLNDPTLNIIKVSLSGRFYLLNKDKVNVFVGPTVGFASGKNKGTGSSAFFPTNFDAETKYSGLNYGVNAGGNYYFTDSLGIIAQLSYEASSLKSSRSQTGTADVDGKTTISGLNIMGGLAFKF